KSGGGFQPGEAPEPDCVIGLPAGQQQAIGRECQITEPPAAVRKVSEHATVGEAPHMDMTVGASGDEFASGTVECQEGNARGMTGKHVECFEAWCFENMNLSSKGATG